VGRRLVLLGASNLLRGFPSVIRAARQAWGDPVEVMAALGHGRSYGMASAFLSRVLPAICDCGLWRALDTRPERPTRALLTDVGNDIIYGAMPDRILAWVDVCLRRLRDGGAEVVVTGLPMDRIERLSRSGYATLRAIFFPVHRWLPFREALERARAVAAGVEELAARHGAVFVEQRGEWYGLDPIHVRPSLWASAWRAILFAGEEPPPVLGDSPGTPSAGRLYLARPERQRLFGREQRREQPALRLPGGGTVSLY
jgi:hypothetical protein